MHLHLVPSHSLSAATRFAVRGALVSAAVFAWSAIAQPVAPVQLNWLDSQPPATPQGVSWGVPWPKGKVQKSDSLVLKTADGKAIPVQTWPMAFWPDGSIMWSGQSISAAPDLAGPLQLVVGAATDPAVKIVCTEDNQAIAIDTGAIRVRLPRQGPSLVESISIGDRKIAQDGKLVCRLEDRSAFETTRTIREEEFISRIKTVTLEQSGPIRAVVKIEGDHKSTSSGRAWLPFVVRLYFNAGLDSIRIVHSFVFDSDGQKDFIKGLAISFAVPLREEVINRHVRFGGDEGMWAEPVKPIGRPPRDALRQRALCLPQPGGRPAGAQSGSIWPAGAAIHPRHRRLGRLQAHARQRPRFRDRKAHAGEELVAACHRREARAGPGISWRRQRRHCH